MIKLKNKMKVIMINPIRMKEVRSMIKVEPDLIERKVKKETLDIEEIVEKKIDTGAIIEIEEKWEIIEIVTIIEIEGIGEIIEVIEEMEEIKEEIKEIIEIEAEIEEIIEIVIGIKIEITINIKREMINKMTRKDMVQEIIKNLTLIKRIANKMDHKGKIVRNSDS